MPGKDYVSYSVHRSYTGTQTHSVNLKCVVNVKSRRKDFTFL